MTFHWYGNDRNTVKKTKRVILSIIKIKETARCLIITASSDESDESAHLASAQSRQTLANRMHKLSRQMDIQTKG